MEIKKLGFGAMRLPLTLWIKLRKANVVLVCPQNLNVLEELNKAAQFQVKHGF